MTPFKTNIKPINGQSLAEAKQIIESDGLVAFPTETVYGLGGNALSDSAIKSIYEVKGRPSDNPLIVHVHCGYDLSTLVEKKYNYIDKLTEAFLPGPLTMVYDSKGKVSSYVSCGLDTLAIRIPSHIGAQEFLRYVDLPIAAPSANVSKHISPTSSKHVYDDLFGRIPLILEGGSSSGGIESTVLDVTTEVPRILRQGLVTQSMIIGVVGKCEIAEHKEGDRVRSPGVKYRHYAPKCPAKLFSRERIDDAISEYRLAQSKGCNPVILCDNKLKTRFSDFKCIFMGDSSREIAASLYGSLREAENQADYIIAIEVSGDCDIDSSIMNRLSKSCAPDVNGKKA